MCFVLGQPVFIFDKVSDRSYYESWNIEPFVLFEWRLEFIPSIFSLDGFLILFEVLSPPSTELMKIYLPGYRTGGLVMTQSRNFLAILVLACLIFFGVSADGYSQQQSGDSQTPGKEQKTNKIMTWPRRQGGSIQVVADLSVSPLVHTGSCPAVFTFKGRIYANKATAVTYKFIRSDGVHSEAKTLVFEKEGRQEVTYKWEMGDVVKLPTFRGGAVMQVIYPINMKMQSNEAIFRGTCTGQGMPEPVNPAGQQKVLQGPTGVESLFPPSRGQQGQPAMAIPPTMGQPGQPPVAFPPPSGQQGQPTMPSLPPPAGQ
jgi:hypothetical protein